MADQTTTTGGNLQLPGVPQNNDSTTVQQQKANTLPSTEKAAALQTNTSDVNNLRTTNLQVKDGPPVSANQKHVSGTALSIILVVIILGAAAALFIASLRVSDDKKVMPSVAPGAEESGALGKTKKSKHRKKSKR